jgi:hypothetical protein
MERLRFYDVGIDRYRTPTQRDLDVFAILNQAYGAIRFAYNHTDRTPEKVMAAVEEAHSKAVEKLAKLPPK